MKTLFTILIILVAVGTVTAQDSTKRTLQILPRVHYGGYFPFTGALLNHSPVVDVNIFYEKRSLGFFLFQSVDVRDRHSYVNYMQPGLFATLKLHPTLKVRGFVGYIFSQAQGFRDSDSDFYTAGSLYWNPSKKLSIQNTLLFFDITIREKLANRILISWSEKRFKADFFLWNRWVLDEKRQAVSASIALTFPIIKLSDNADIQLTSAYMGYLTHYRPSFALSDGFLFTLSVPVNVQ